jgi:hypothetical protein
MLGLRNEHLCNFYIAYNRPTNIINIIKLLCRTLSIVLFMFKLYDISEARSTSVVRSREPSASVKAWKFFDQLSYCKFLTEGSV